MRKSLSDPLGHRNEDTAEHLTSNLQNIEIKQVLSTNRALDNSENSGVRLLHSVITQKQMIIK